MASEEKSAPGMYRADADSGRIVMAAQGSIKDQDKVPSTPASGSTEDMAGEGREVEEVVVSVDGLIKRYPMAARLARLEGAAVRDVFFAVHRGELFTLLGPSGCGKTTTLRCIAGLETPDRGEIHVNGECVFSSSQRKNLAASRRPLAMVFQSYAIWPHMTVRQNVEFPLVVEHGKARLSKAERRSRVLKALARVQLAEYLDRPATDLSGGQQQRLAVARALVTRPPLVLLDEPLSNLDANLRLQMRAELLDMQRSSGMTSIYVTHDQSEALALSTRIAVMSRGTIEQVGAPQDVYYRPQSRFVAEFVGDRNIIAGTVTGTDDAGCRVSTPLGEFETMMSRDFSTGDEVFLTILAEEMELARGEEQLLTSPLARQRNHVAGRVRSALFGGQAVDQVVETIDGTRLRVRCAFARSQPPGAVVDVRFPPEACWLMPQESTREGS